jgi:predicted nucleotidyltransferase
MIPEERIAQISRCLDDKKIPYMLIGGQAVLLYGRPRFTRDIDITLGVDSDQYEAIAQVCKDVGLKILPVEPKVFAAQTNVLPADDPISKLRVDFIFSSMPYERQALKRAQKVELAGYPVCFASCEDVIIHKMLAGRAIDEEDVKSILVRRRSEIDIEYVKGWLEKFETMPEFAGVLDKFENLLEQ